MVLLQTSYRDDNWTHDKYKDIMLSRRNYLSASSFFSSGFSTQFPVAQPKPISSACGGLDSSSTHHILGSSRVSPIRPVTASLSFAEVVLRAPKFSANTGGPQCKSTGQATLVMRPKHSRSGYTASRFNT
jgi:hypothetical protein